MSVSIYVYMYVLQQECNSKELSLPCSEKRGIYMVSFFFSGDSWRMF